MINNKIDGIHRQYMFAIEPVKLFETQKDTQAQKSSFDFLNRMNSKNYNPLHPNVANATMAKKLDIMS